MKTIKTACVVVVLLGVLYGVYVVLNQPESKEQFEEDWSKYGVDDFNIETGEAFTGAPMALDGFQPPAPFQPPANVPAVPGGMNAFNTPASDSDFAPPSSAPFEPPPQFAQNNNQFPGSGSDSAAGDFAPPESTVYSPRPTEPGTTPPPVALTAPVATQPTNPTAEGMVVNPYIQSGSASGNGVPAFETGFAEVERLVESDKFVEALRMLTLYYDRPDLTPMQQVQVSEWIDLLAKKVVYSTEHFLEAPYRVRRGDTLESIATQYQVSPTLLFNINSDQIRQPDVLTPGTQLKVVRGPFRAEVNLQRQKLTLFIGDLYAGRFDISVGSDPAPVPGSHTVLDKQQGAAYYPQGSGVVPVGHPENPYGRHWLGLSQSLSIHGVARSPNVPADKGCISLSPLDAQDVFGILAKGSRVVIR